MNLLGVLINRFSECPDPVYDDEYDEGGEDDADEHEKRAVDPSFLLWQKIQSYNLVMKNMSYSIFVEYFIHIHSLV